MILLFRGTGLISRAIQLQTRSPYSHAAWMCADGSVYEAWHKGGTQYSHNPFVLHGPEAVFDVFAFNALTGRERKIIEAFLKSELGQPYDFRSVARFLTRRPGGDPDAWFCSEYVAAAIEYAGRPLLNANPEQLAPGHLAWSKDLSLIAERAGWNWWSSKFQSVGSADRADDCCDKCHGSEVPA